VSFKKKAAALLFLTGLVAGEAGAQARSIFEGESEIVYLSPDTENVAVFSPSEARFGPADLALSPGVFPGAPARYFDAGNGVDCASVGPENSAYTIAVQRPLRLGSRYACERTKFRVVRCFEQCRAAVVEVAQPIGTSRNPPTLKSYFLVNSCAGVLAMGMQKAFRRHLPFDAVLLRGERGILADRRYPSCLR
jgi:hypothetical protein